MKNSIQLAILGMAIALSSCIKDKSVVKPIEPDAQVQTQVDDNNKLKVLGKCVLCHWMMGLSYASNLNCSLASQYHSR
jgi:cytochrome c553